MQVSKNKVKNNIWKKAWNCLIRAIVESKQDSLSLLLTRILLQDEQIMVTKRLMIGILTMSKWNAKDISMVLKMSKTTVHHYQILLKFDQEYQNLLKELFPEPIEVLETERIKSNREELMGIFERMFQGRQKRYLLYGMDEIK